MAAKKASRPTAWDVWLSQLTPEARRLLQGGDRYAAAGDPDGVFIDYDAWEAGLDEGTRAALAAKREAMRPVVEPVVPEPEPDLPVLQETWRYGCVLQTEEGYPGVKLFKSFEDLVRYMGQHDGEDETCCPFHGIPLRYTVPPRHLYHPDGQTVAVVPLHGFGEVRAIPAEAIRDTLPLQTDWYLGPPELGTVEGTDLMEPTEEVLRIRQQDREAENDGDGDDAGRPVAPAK